jgi:hypothetical protein
LIAAITLKNLLLKMIVDAFLKHYEDTKMRYATEEMCLFLANLMHSEITTLKLPMLNSTLHPLDFAFKRRMTQMYKSPAGQDPMSLQELHEASCGVLVLINVIGAQCSKLKSLSIMDLPWHSPLVPLMPLTEGSIFGPAFFQVLPRLTTLKMKYYLCGNWALKQIGIHATNLA